MAIPPTTPASLGSLIDVGAVRGGLVAAAPGGRYVAMRVAAATLVVLDVDAGLATTMSCALRGPICAAAVHPNGRAVVVLTADWELELFHADGAAPIRVATEIARSAAAGEDQRAWGFLGVGWLHYTRDGALLFGESTAGHARLSLLDPATLAPVDRIASLWSDELRGPITDWGEGVEAVDGPGSTVAFSSNLGDSILVLGVAEVIAGKLVVHGPRDQAHAFSSQIAGPRIWSLALVGPDDLVVLDSDQIVSRVRFREPAPEVIQLDSTYVVRKQARVAVGEPVVLDGSMFAAGVTGSTLAIPIAQERAAGDLAVIALGFVDPVGDRPLGIAAVPGGLDADSTDIDGGTLCLLTPRGTQVLRWRPTAPPR